MEGGHRGAAIAPLDAAAMARLEGFLGNASGGRAKIHRIKRLRGGAIQENWRIEVNFGNGDSGPTTGEQILVLRTSSPCGIAESLPPAHEFAILRAAAGAGVTVPAPLWACDDEKIIGRPFFVMQWIDGVSLGHRIVRDTVFEPYRDALAERLGAELARIHTLGPGRPAGLDFLPLPTPDPASTAIAAYRAYLDRQGAPHPVLEWGLRWAELNLPRESELVLCHRDFRTGNYMVTAERPSGGGLTGILDWEFAGWGAPMEDIAWFCAKCWRFGVNECDAGGISRREIFYRGYRETSGREIDHRAVEFWEVMAHVRWAVIAIQQADRFLSGAEPALELAAIGRRPAEMELEILKLTGVY